MSPPVPTFPALRPSLPLTGSLLSFQKTTEGLGGVGGRAGALDFAGGADGDVTQGRPVRSALG